MANIKEEYKKYQAGQKQKIAELKKYIQRVIDEYIKVTECIPQDLMDEFIVRGNYCLLDNCEISMERSATNEMMVYMRDDICGSAFYNAYDGELLAEINKFLDKEFEMLELQIIPRADVNVIDDYIVIYFKFYDKLNFSYGLSHKNAIVNSAHQLMRSVGAEHIREIDDEYNNWLVMLEFKLST